MVAAERVGLRASAVRTASRTLSALLDGDDRTRTLLSADALPQTAQYLEEMRRAVARGGMTELRVMKRLLMLQIAAFDLSGEVSLERVSLALSDLADACLQVCIESLDAQNKLGIVAMGKLGARELNYVSDIDVMFVADGDHADAAKAAALLLQQLGEFAPEGRAYIVDANLRPEGKAGALVRSVDGYLEYYGRWAAQWEFQALIKARAAAGNMELAEQLVLRTRPFVYRDDIDPDRIAAVRKMKQRVEEHAARSSRKKAGDASDDVKLGPGGIRDIEFSVQLLQLVHGGGDPSVRVPATVGALVALVDGGYLAEEDAAGLSVAYRWLRTVEHRLQLSQERRVHRLPTDDAALRSLARTMGFRDSPLASAQARFVSAHHAVLADVRGRFERLFYRPMIEALADPVATRMSEDALKERLRVLGFRDVDRAARVLGGLVTGTSRRAKLVRLLTPALLRFLSVTPLPDDGLFAFLRLAEALTGRPEALGALRDNPPGIEFLARVLGSGRLLGELLPQLPEELQTIADPAGPGPVKDRDRLVREAIASLSWRDPERRLDGLRRFKRREMFGIALTDLAGRADTDGVGRALADLAEACLEAALGDAGAPFAVIGMGKLGGRELNYASDIDVMFVHDADSAVGERIAERLIRAIGEVTPEGQAFKIDPGLRPEGRAGPLARSLQSYLEYYERWGRPWEYQALIKARCVAGDRDLGRRFMDAVAAWPFGGPPDMAFLQEVRHLKARMEKERIPRGTDPRRNMKMGPGGTADIEFAAQVLQLLHGHRHESLRVTGTVEALVAAAEAGLVTDEQRDTMLEAYRFLSTLRNRLFFMMGRPHDALPTRSEDVEALGVAMGFTDQPRQELEETYLRITRRTRRVSEPLIYG